MFCRPIFVCSTVKEGPLLFRLPPMRPPPTGLHHFDNSHLDWRHQSIALTFFQKNCTCLNFFWYSVTKDPVVCSQINLPIFYLYILQTNICMFYCKYRNLDIWNPKTCCRYSKLNCKCDFLRINVCLCYMDCKRIRLADTRITFILHCCIGCIDLRYCRDSGDCSDWRGCRDCKDYRDCKETVYAVETVKTENLKKVSLTYSVTDNLKARDASASKN